jgi:hypothetical protein
MLFILSLTVLPSIALANTPDPAAVKPTTEVPAEVQRMYDRLEEIKAMDKSEMTRAEKKELRKEVRAIKSDLKASGNGGIYLSVGAIIIIVLLLILLL